MPGKSVKVRISPEAGALTGRPDGLFSVDVDYQQLVDGDHPAAEVGTNLIAQSQRVELDANLSATVDLANVALPSNIMVRFLAADGTTKISKTLTVPSANAATEALVLLSASDVAALLTPAKLLPANPVLPKVTRAAIFAKTSEADVPFARSKILVAALASAEHWERLGLGKIFQSTIPITSAVEYGQVKIGEIGSVPWKGVHLGVDGRFDATFDKGSGIGWIWWLNGPKSAIGAVSGDDLEAPNLRLVIPLPAFPVTKSSDPSVPKPQADDRLVPANPTEADLAHNPEIYTEDPGAFCEPFRKPDRVVSERSFSTIVRVEQPEISAVPSSKMTSISLLELDPAESPSAIASRSGSRTTPTSLSNATLASKFLNFLPKRINFPSSYSKAIANLGSGRSLAKAGNPIPWEDFSNRFQAASVARGHILEFRVRWRSNGYSLGTVAKTLTLAARQTRRIQKISWERHERARRDERTQLRDEVRDETLRERSYDDEVRGSLSEWAAGESHAREASAAAGIGFAVPPIVGGGGGTAARADSWSEQHGGRDTTAAEEQRLRDAIRRYGDALRRFESTIVTEVTQHEDVTGTTEIIRNPNYGHSLTVIFYQILRHLRVDTEFAGVRECLFVPFAISPFTYARAHRWRDALRSGMKEPRFTRALSYLKDVLTHFTTSDIPEGIRADQPIRVLRGSLYLTLAIDRPRDTADGKFDETKWQILNSFVNAPILGITAKLAALAESTRDTAFQRDDAPGIAANWVNTLTLHDDNGRLINADFTLATQYAFRGRVRVDFVATMSGQHRATLQKPKIVATAPLPPGSVANLTGMNFTYATDQFERSVMGNSGVNDLINPVSGKPDQGAVVPAPLSAWERVNQRNEMTQAVADLMEHLNAHVEYYHKVIWWNMDRDRLFMLLDGFYVPGTKDISIASVVDKQPVAIVGNALVYPVSAGSFLGIGPVTTPEQLFARYKEEGPPREPLNVALPTDGLYAQTIMDPCLALEEHYGNLDWVLDDKEPDLGTIAPELMMTRRADTSAETNPTELPQTIINLQNAPEAPGVTGLAGVLQALGKADAFRDMAGLAGTQAAAQAALQTAAGLATTFGSQAAALKIADMAAKDKATQNADKQVASVERAKQKELITPEQANEQVGKILDQIHSPSASPAPLDRSTLQDAILKAAGQPGSEIEHSDSLGNLKVKLAAWTPIVAAAVAGVGAATHGVSLNLLRARLDTFLDQANAVYTLKLPDGSTTTVRALPQFRISYSFQPPKNLLNKLGAPFRDSFQANYSSADLPPGRKYDVFHMAKYGRALVGEVTAITQKLIDTLDTLVAPIPAQSIRDLQSEYGVGLDCAGYVQQAFIYAFTGSVKLSATDRQKIGLKAWIGDENLASLDNVHFQEIGFLNAQTGDLFVLDKKDGDWHTMMVVDHTVSGEEHTWVVDASWGLDAYTNNFSGVARRTIKFDPSRPAFSLADPDSGKWWDENPMDPTKRGYPNDIGPYRGHTIKGVYRLRQRSLDAIQQAPGASILPNL